MPRRCLVHDPGRRPVRPVRPDQTAIHLETIGCTIRQSKTRPDDFGIAVRSAHNCEHERPLSEANHRVDGYSISDQRPAVLLSRRCPAVRLREEPAVVTALVALLRVGLVACGAPAPRPSDGGGSSAGADSLSGMPSGQLTGRTEAENT